MESHQNRKAITRVGENGMLPRRIGQGGWDAKLELKLGEYELQCFTHVGITRGVRLNGYHRELNHSATFD